VLRGADGFLRKLDAGDGGEVRRESDGEEAGAAVGVDEVGWLGCGPAGEDA